jgi:hypothetical protein
MSNKDNLIIQPSDEIISHTALQSDVIFFDKEKRQKVIQILRQIPAILDVAKKLSEGKTYRAYIAPEVLERINEGSARLANRDNGLFGANILDVETGKIIHNASLMEVTPDLLSSLNQLAIQQTLANIVHRLEAIDEKITDVLQGQFNDRLAEVKSGIRMYKDAVLASDPDVRRGLMISAIQKLNDGRSKLIESADFGFIDKLPRNRLGMFFSLNWDIPKYVQSKTKPIWEAAYVIVEASCYMNEPDSARVSLEQAEREVKVFQEKMEQIVNWLPPTSSWRESLTTISQGILPNIRDLDNIPQKTIVLEFQPKEITTSEGV